MQELNASNVINFNMKPCVYISPSQIKNSGDGLYTKRHIPKDMPIVVYYGDKITDQEVYEMYINKPDEYYKINGQIRGTQNGFAIKGNKSEPNLNLSGIYVNDISCIKCKKEEINEDILKEYAKTYKKCNLKSVNTKDYPVYISIKRINKNEELYVHYGIGFWLSMIGCTPDEINELNSKYNFDNFYL